MVFWSLMKKTTRRLVQPILRYEFQGKRTINYYGKSHQKILEIILLWKKTKRFFGLQIFPNIITEKWGLWQIQNWYITSSYVTSEMNLIIVSSRTSLDFVDKHCISGNLVMLFLLSRPLQYSAYFTSYQV